MRNAGPAGAPLLRRVRRVPGRSAAVRIPDAPMLRFDYRPLRPIRSVPIARAAPTTIITTYPAVSCPSGTR